MGGGTVVAGRPAGAGWGGERGRVGKGDPHRPLLGLCGVVVFWLQIQEAHGAGLALVGTSPGVMTWQAAVVAQVTSHAASHLNWFHLQALAADSIDVHGDDLQVRVLEYFG